MIRPTALALVAALAAAPAAAADWIASWAAPPTAAMKATANMPPQFATPVFKDQTVVQVVRLTAGGKRLRLRLTNEYGAKPLAIGAARVAAVGADGKPRASVPVTFSGQTKASIAARAPLLSDPIDLSAAALSNLQVSLYLPGEVDGCSCHGLGLQTAQLSPPGDFTGRPFTPASTTQSRAFLSAVEVEASSRAPVVVTFGDSITDGAGSTADANRRWPDVLAERLIARRKGAAVVNGAISGNRVLSDSPIAIFGESALTRFDRDVLALPGVTHLIVLEGVNDLGGRPTPSAQDLIAGYRQLIDRAHAHGIKVIGATILPYGGAAYFRPEGEAARQAVNTWIRSGKAFDGVVDFDAATRDPANPTKLRAELHGGDWLHPNDAGYKVMGEAVDLALFR